MSQMQKTHPSAVFLDRSKSVSVAINISCPRKFNLNTPTLNKCLKTGDLALLALVECHLKKQTLTEKMCASVNFAL